VCEEILRLSLLLQKRGEKGCSKCNCREGNAITKSSAAEFFGACWLREEEMHQVLKRGLDPP